MPRVRSVVRASGTVVVVSSNAETLDGMHQYFSQTGIASSSRSLLDPNADLSGAVQALVVFPDDFKRHDVSAYLSFVRSQRPDLTMVIVTRDPPAFLSMTSASGRPLDAIVLPRPAFGWTILDAIRAQSGARSADQSDEKGS